MKENMMLDGKNQNPSYVFSIYIKNFHPFMEVLGSQDSLQWKKAKDFEFQSLQDNKT
jgi:hypothetical protein